MMSYKESLEREKAKECQKALEREKIACGMRYTRKDEIELREMQKLQMLEKKNIEREEETLEAMWHQVLLEDFRAKEHREREQHKRRQQQMLEHRIAYDEQIASANRKRQEALREEREIESRRLERMRKKMEEDHCEALKRKKIQQQENKQNYIKGHEMTMTRLIDEKRKAREIDDNTIRVALEELRRDRVRQRNEIKRLQLEKQIFLEHRNRERMMASNLDEAYDNVVQEWNNREHNASDKYHKALEEDRRIQKEKSAQEYRNYLNQRQLKLEKDRQERSAKMQRVQRTAIQEIERNLRNAEDELKRQLQYKKTLNSQLLENQQVMEKELNEFESKQRAFTKKAAMFIDAMKNNVDVPTEKTNPVHPFRQLINTQRIQKSHNLPLLQ